MQGAILGMQEEKYDISFSLLPESFNTPQRYSHVIRD